MKTAGIGRQEFTVDNSWVVPSSPDLLRKFRTHMNVELCISKVGSIKYLFKYVCKGPDTVTVEVKTVQEGHEQSKITRMIPIID